MGKRKTTAEFIMLAINRHLYMFSYDKVNYINSKTDVIITCGIHGDFTQRPNNHLTGAGCPLCGLDAIKHKKSKTTDEFISTATKIFRDRYIYDESFYIGARKPITIICKLHGKFKQKPNDHLGGHGCPACVNVSVLTNETFLEKVKNVHNKFYYPNLTIQGTKVKIEIVCPKHGSFWQAPANHLRGQGCPICKESSGEKKIRVWLTDHTVIFSQQYKTSKCKNRRPLPFDFAILDNDQKVVGLIEYQGEQHFTTKTFGNSSKVTLKDIQYRDKIKRDYCHTNQIPLLIVPHWDKVNIPTMLEKFILSTINTVCRQ
jgi:hypothetical protein